MVFGPVMMLWFLTIGLLGLGGIVHQPAVLRAVFPWYAISFLFHGGWHAFLVLGSVFLVTTGGEALYADMGHFGRAPIRIAWFAIVLPGLLLNYFGQGALYLGTEPVEHPFFGLAPRVLLVPLVLLATLATVIASQALISGVFSLTRQAIQLGYSPRMPIEHTSAQEIGQIYVSSINWGLLICTVAVVIGFGSASALANAYGVAVATTMVITSILAYILARRTWGWSVPLAVGVWGTFLVVEMAFWLANMTKVAEGGWFPLALGVGVFTLMTTWHRGRSLLSIRLHDQSMTMDVFQKVLEEDKPIRVEGTAVFMTPDTERVPPALHRNMVHNRVVHQRVVLVTVLTEEVPYVGQARRLEVDDLGQGFWRVVVSYGFMEDPDIPGCIARCRSYGLDVPLDETTYFLGRETVVATEQPGMALWREHLFSFMSANAQSATAFFRIPPAQVIEIGAQIEI
jgi:KUP system potassium uptake protein